jgi:CP family cyanate transporter-like MFS transporter
VSLYRAQVQVRRWPLLVAVLLVAVNLRGPIAAVSPVLTDIKASLHLSAGAAGLLTTLPVLCFAAASALIGHVARWVGVNRAMLVGLAGIVAGTALRSVGGLPELLAGTLALGVAITIGNVLVPVVVKQNFGRSAATVTGSYTAALTGGAALTAAATAPLASLLGWRAALATWSVLAVAGIAVWWYAAPGEPPVEESQPRARATGVLRHPVAWAICGYLGAQATTYYAVTAWLPTQLTDDAGLDPQVAGVGMSIFQLVGIVGTLAVPVLVGRSRRQSWLGALVASTWAVMLLGLLLAPSAWPVWTVVGGVAQGAGISLAFTLIVVRAGDADVARQLSGMAQAVGYSIGAAGPFVVGLVFQHSGGWTLPLVLLLGVCVVILVTAVIAGRDVRIGEPVAVPTLTPQGGIRQPEHE